MMPMANRLQKVLEESSFDYTDAEYEADIVEITELGNNKDAEVEGDKRLIKRGTNMVQMMPKQRNPRTNFAYMSAQSTT